VPCPLFNLIPTFALQMRKSTENLSQVSQLVLDNSHCVDCQGNQQMHPLLNANN
jgi:hypothetical protein